MTDILGWFNPTRWIALAVILAALGGVYAWRVHVERDVGRDEVQLKWDADNARRTAAALAETEKNRLIEAERSRLAAQAQQRKDDELQRINTRLAAALGELRNRPERPTAGGVVSGNPAAVQGCTGAQLFRPDSEFLVREAARADRILAERDYCHERYNSLTVNSK